MNDRLWSCRRATHFDLPGLQGCDAYASTHPARVDELRSWVEEGACLGTWRGDAPVGFVVLQYTFFGHGFIPLICVAPDHRRRGIAQRLLAYAEQQCRTPKLFTSTNASNLAAQCLFSQAGFVASGHIDNLDQGDPELVFFKPAVAAVP